MPYLKCDKRYFSYKNLHFFNYKHKYNSKDDHTYKLAKEIPIDNAIIKDEKGNIINKPIDIPDKDSSIDYIKKFVKINGLDEEIDLRKSKESILERIKEILDKE